MYKKNNRNNRKKTEKNPFARKRYIENDQQLYEEKATQID